MIQLQLKVLLVTVRKVASPLKLENIENYITG